MAKGGFLTSYPPTHVTVVKELIRLDLWTNVKEILCATSHHALPVPHTVVQFDLRNADTLVHIPQSAGPPHLSEFRHEHLDDGMIWVCESAVLYQFCYKSILYFQNW